MSTDVTFPGRITSFRLDQGFGTITLDDGRALPFDAAICTFVPAEGQAVIVQVGKAKWGNKDKCTWVVPADAHAAVVAPAVISLDQQVGALHAQYLANALTEDVLAGILAKLGGSAPALVDVLDAYYAEDPSRAQADGYLGPGARPADVTALLLRVAPGTQAPTDSASLPDAIGLANDQLRGTASPTRFYPITGAAGRRAYLTLTRDRALALATTLPFATPPADVA